MDIKQIGRNSDLATVFQSSRAVGMIVGTADRHQGGFFTPTEAREIAAELLRSADAAERNPSITREQAAAIVEKFSMDDAAAARVREQVRRSPIGFQFVEQGIYAEVAHESGRPSRHPLINGRTLRIRDANPDLADEDIILFDNYGLFLSARKTNAEGRVVWN